VDRAYSPAYQSSTDTVADRVEDDDGSLIAHITLFSAIRSNNVGMGGNIYQEHIDRRLFTLILEIVDICSRDTFGSIGKNAFMYDQRGDRPCECVTIPARVRFPLRVMLVLSAPVPAYIRERASPFSAHNSR
jgi:hypothetical protein